MATILSSSVTSTAYKITKTVTGIECDVCNKVIPVKELSYNDQNRYFRVTTGHCDWGNDSCDSVETIDICPDCVVKYIENYLRDCSRTAYLRLETETIWARKTYEVVDRPPDDGEISKEYHDSY